ncbi:MAG: hypothetical protein KGJ49_04385 [Alphaproteobacteria bacterium]|nr:hypothetical protein [Alphaproteobacteria bacterium]
MRLMDDPDPKLLIYVYPYRNNRRDGEVVYIGNPYDGLLGYLRDEFGSASYYVMIRRGRRMDLAGIIGIAAPLNWRKRT